MDSGLIAANMRSLSANPYPGRGIVIGLSPDARHYVQVYWIMGRSANSRNRIFVEEDGFVRTKAFDQSKLTDPSLVIYYPVKHCDGRHIVTNGDQTETILAHLRDGGSFEGALLTREFEPDAPHYTPRISGIVDLNDRAAAYRLSILKPTTGGPRYCARHFFTYAQAQPGVGHCLHTYAGDGDPLPPFAGEPYPLPLAGSPAETARLYWDSLHPDNRVAVLAKFIEVETGRTSLEIINRHR